ncbi:MAG: ATP synthase F1 subunit delta [Candidatus Margulisiibacteriota bacterium]
MRITVKQYARSLYESVVDKKAGEAVANFLKLLIKNNDLKLADKIIAEFVRIWNEHEGLITAEVVSARKLDKESDLAIKNYLKEQQSAKSVELKKSVDGKLLAGFILKFGDQVIDGSLKKKIAQLKEEMIK